MKKKALMVQRKVLITNWYFYIRVGGTCGLCTWPKRDDCAGSRTSMVQWAACKQLASTRLSCEVSAAHSLTDCAARSESEAQVCQVPAEQSAPCASVPRVMVCPVAPPL